MEEKVLGIVVKSVDYKDNDKLLTLLTTEGKKISLLKGCKKSSAKLKFAGELFCLGEFIIISKGQFNTIINCSLIDLFYDLRKDLKKVYPAYVILEIVDRVPFFEDDCQKLFTLVVECLKNICYKNNCENSTLAYFMIEFLTILGYEINLENCSVCGKSLHKNIRYSANEKSFVCSECEGVLVDETVVSALLFIKNCREKENSGVKISTGDIFNSIDVLTEYVQNCFEIKLKSTEIYKKMR